MQKLKTLTTISIVAPALISQIGEANGGGLLPSKGFQSLSKGTKEYLFKMNRAQAPSHQSFTPKHSSQARNLRGAGASSKHLKANWLHSSEPELAEKGKPDFMTDIDERNRLSEKNVTLQTVLDSAPPKLLASRKLDTDNTPSQADEQTDDQVNRARFIACSIIMFGTVTASVLYFCWNVFKSSDHDNDAGNSQNAMNRSDDNTPSDATAEQQANGQTLELAAYAERLSFPDWTSLETLPDNALPAQGHCPITLQPFWEIAQPVRILKSSTFSATSDPSKANELVSHNQTVYEYQDLKLWMAKKLAELPTGQQPQPQEPLVPDPCTGAGFNIHYIRADVKCQQIDIKTAENKSLSEP